MDVEAYLRRIGYQGSREPSLATLRGLQQAHMRSVPFENIDIYFKRRRLDLDEVAFFNKVVCERRGGFCYELNGLFAWLLRQLGFDAQYLSGRVIAKGAEGPEFDHLLLFVPVEGRRMIADAGFGDSSRLPLDLDETGPQGDPPGAWRVQRDPDGDWTMSGRGTTGKWAGAYRFTLRPRRLDEFAAMCLHHQTSPNSHFTQGHVCSRATLEGRITVSGNRLIVMSDGKRTITRVPDDAAWRKLLRESFEVEFGELGPVAGPGPTQSPES